MVKCITAFLSRLSCYSPNTHNDTTAHPGGIFYAWGWMISSPCSWVIHPLRTAASTIVVRPVFRYSRRMVSSIAVTSQSIQNQRVHRVLQAGKLRFQLDVFCR